MQLAGKQCAVHLLRASSLPKDDELCVILQAERIGPGFSSGRETTRKA